MVTMELTYYGHSCFKVKTKDLVLVIDPFDPNKLGIKLPKLEADVLLLTHDHFDHSYKAGVSGYRLLIDGPGEYELSGVDIVGIPVDHDGEHGSVRGKNTMYYIESEGVSVLHCGDLGHELDDATLAKFGEVTALMLPIGGVYTIGPEQAAKVVSSIEPSFVVPMHYKIDGSKIADLGTLAKFLDEMGVDAQNGTKLDKLKLSSSDSELETKVVVLERQ